MNFLKCESKILVIIHVFFIFLNCNQSYNDIASNNYISVSGKILNLDTGKGIPDINIEILEKFKGYRFGSTTDKDGNFNIEMVPKGVYKIISIQIYRSCPKELIISKMPKTINLISGENIKNIKIYLQRGADISGYVYAADGVTPLNNIDLMIEPWLPFKYKKAHTDKQGKYAFIGLEGGKKTIHHTEPGFANESVCINVKPGKMYENVNFILGKGNVSVRGKVSSANDNQIITDVSLFFTSTQLNQYYSSGWAETDNNGEYSIIGLKYPGTFELSTVDMSEEFEDIERDVELKLGENILDIKLKPKKKLKKRNRKFKK